LDVNHGIAGFLLANGALGDEDDMPIRKNVIESDKVEAIIVLPRDMFYTTDISVTLWILNMDKKAGELNGLKTRDRQGEMLFVDLRTWDQNVQEIKIDQKQRKKKTILTDEQIAEVKTLLSSWRNADQSKYHDVPEFCKSVRIHGEGGIASNNYLLAPSQYIEFINHDLDIDFEKEMQRVQKEMANVIAEEQKSKEELCNAFEAIGYAIK
jgi:type I restriction enzyme M protein